MPSNTTFSGIPGYRPPLRERLRRLEETALETARGWWQFRTSEPRRRRNTLIGLSAAGAVLALAIAGGASAIWGPRFQPDYDTAQLDDVFDYTLLSSEFNNLSVEERMALLGKLVQRMKGMDAEDSVLLAAFASGIAGSARRQLEENASRLAIDLWDKHAKEYALVPAAQREDFLESAFIDFMKTMELVTGEVSDKSDSERINEVRTQARKDIDWVKKNPDKLPDGKSMGRVFSIMNNNVGGHATAQQKVRGQQMIRDMMRHFRGQDLATGKLKGGG